MRLHTGCMLISWSGRTLRSQAPLDLSPALAQMKTQLAAMGYAEADIMVLEGEKVCPTVDSQRFCRVTWPAELVARDPPAGDWAGGRTPHMTDARPAW